MTENSMVLGAMYFGTRVDERTSMGLLDRFVDRGGSWIDTANCYAFWADSTAVGGQSETVIGRWLASRPGIRDRVRISTKVRQQPTRPGDWPASAEGLSGPAIGAALRQSLTRLGTDRIDLYWAHAEDRTVPLAQTVAAFGELVDSGLVRRLGASNHAVWRIERARRIAAEQQTEGYTAVQLRMSYVQPRPGAELAEAGHRLASSEALDYVRSEPGLLLWAYTALLNGAYTRADRPLPEYYQHAGTTRRLAVLGAVAEELGVSRNQLVLAWMRRSDPRVIPIVGVSTAAQLDEAMAADEIGLSEVHLDRLNEPA